MDYIDYMENGAEADMQELKRGEVDARRDYASGDYCFKDGDSLYVRAYNEELDNRLHQELVDSDRAGRLGV